MHDEVIAKYGKVDVILNNAAMVTFKPIAELEIEECYSVSIDLNDTA